MTFYFLKTKIYTKYKRSNKLRQGQSISKDDKSNVSSMDHLCRKPILISRQCGIFSRIA